jgi:DNA repair exonuclease SbcCD ATPase subunit
MNKRIHSTSTISSFKRITNPMNQENNNLHSLLYNKTNNILTQNKFGLHKSYHDPNKINLINNTISPYSYQRIKRIYQRENNNKAEYNIEDVSKIIIIIQCIKKNQEKILSMINGLKANNNKNKENEEDKNKINNSKLLDSIKKLKEEYDLMKNEISILKKKDEENKKIIESNLKEIENLKKRFNCEDSNDSNKEILNEKNKKIEELEELVKKLQTEKKEINNKYNDSLNTITEKNKAIENLKEQLKNKIVNQENINKEAKDNKNENHQKIENSTIEPRQNKNNLSVSISLNSVPNRQFTGNDGNYVLGEKKAEQ